MLGKLVNDRERSLREITVMVAEARFRSRGSWYWGYAYLTLGNADSDFLIKVR
jgi:hypothetical protein